MSTQGNYRMLDAVQHDLTELAMDTRVGDLIRKSPLMCLPSTPLGQVFRVMDQEKAGSMLVADEHGALQGILTRYDLIKRVLLPELPLSTPIGQVMSGDLKTIDAQAGVLEAMLMMARHGFRHLPVMHHGFLVGLVSERDLFAHQRSSLRILSSSIEQAETIPDLKVCAAEVMALARRLMAQGVAATSLARLVSHLNDALTRRVIVLVQRQMQAELGQLPRWSWLALGSEGREEQTVATDQDNAIIFEGDGPALRPTFLKLAEQINHGLAEIGFPLCNGGVMAMHEKWCKSADEWRAVLDNWFTVPNPQALLDANIFLDFRGLYGEAELAERLRAWVSAQIGEHRLFLRSLAQDAMRDEVGSLTGSAVKISLARAARRRGWKADWLAPVVFDMKRHATAPVVYFVRVLALANGVADTSTDGRLHGLVDRKAMSESETQQMRDAFNVLQRYRLRAQLAYALLSQDEKSKGVSPNVLNLDSLSIHEQERLAQALQTLGNLRARIEMDFLR
jgi:CBS domain-containing protein